MVDPLDPDIMRAAWAANNEAAVEVLIADLLAATSPEEVYAAHARFVRATAADFSRQMRDLSDLLQRLAGLT